jgi:DNA polymerase III epsilon subunit-like protein
MNDIMTPNNLTKNIEYISNNIDDIKKIINYIENISSINSTENNNKEFNKNYNNNFNKKYTKNCFSNKKINNKCKYGLTCCNEYCKREHPIGWDANESRIRISKITCKFGDNCSNKELCLYFHKDVIKNNFTNKTKSKYNNVNYKKEVKCMIISPLNSPLSIPGSPVDFNSKTRSISISSISSVKSLTSKPEQKYISLYVEYIANGFGHNDRIPCWIIMSDFNNQIIYNEMIDPNKSRTLYDITSTLEPITGININMLHENGISHNKAITKLKNLLDDETVLIGHNIHIDILKLGLQVDYHYKNYIDLKTEFKTATKYGNKIKNKYFSFEHEKEILLSITKKVNKIDIPQITMLIFKNWIKPGETKKNRAKKKLIQNSNHIKNNNEIFVIDGVCCATYRKDKCICSQ